LVHDVQMQPQLIVAMPFHKLRCIIFQDIRERHWE
jgi:hypothetical protein